MTINERFKYVRTEIAKMTQAEFGARLGVTRDAIATIERSTTAPKNIYITSCCREFGISLEWLKDGKGDPKEPLSREAEIAEITAQLYSKSEDYPWILEIEKLLINMDYEQWKLVFEMAKKLAEIAPDE